MTICYWNVSDFPLSPRAWTASQLFSPYSTEWLALVIGTPLVHYIPPSESPTHIWFPGCSILLLISRHQIIKRKQWVQQRYVELWAKCYLISLFYLQAFVNFSITFKMPFFGGGHFHYIGSRHCIISALFNLYFYIIF